MSVDLEKSLSNIGAQAGLRPVKEGGEVPSVRCDLELRETARTLGAHCALLDLFLFGKKSGKNLFYFDHNGERQLMDGQIFRTWIADHVILFKKQKTITDDEGTEKQRPIPYTLTESDANGILRSPIFLAKIKSVKQINEVRLPVVRDTGELVLLPEGYDETSGIWTVRNSLKYDTEQDLAVSQGWFNRYFGTFPFSDERSKGVQIASMLSLYIKHLFPEYTLRPGFLFYANKPGSGKSALAKASLYPVLGNAASAKMKKGEEMDKELEAFSIAGVPYIFLDNVYGGIQSASMDQLLTSTESIGRAMGGHGIFIAENKAQIFITGNNLDLNDDAQRRFLIVDLFEEGDPRERSVESDYLLLDSRMRSEEWRSKALAFLWSVVKNWYDKSKPEGQSILNTFEDFSKIVGGIVTAAGYSDPMVRAEMLDEVNPEVLEFKQLLLLVVKQMEEDGKHEDMITTQDLVKIARAESLLEDKIGTEEQGRAETIRRDGIPKDQRHAAEDLGYLDKKQQSVFGKFLAKQMGSVFRVGDCQLKFGERKERKKSKYSLRIEHLRGNHPF